MDKGQETEVALPSAWTSQHLWSFMALPPTGQVPRLWLPHSLSSFCRMAQGAKGFLLLLHASLQNVVSWPCCMLPYRTWSAGLTAPHHEITTARAAFPMCSALSASSLADEPAGFTRSSRFLPWRDTKGKLFREPIHVSCLHLSWYHRLPFIIKHVSHPTFCLKQGWNLHVGLNWWQTPCLEIHLPMNITRFYSVKNGWRNIMFIWFKH